eukprot:g1178.t1
MTNILVLIRKEILQLQVFRDNLWTSVEHALARLAFEGCISLNAHMVDGPWFNRKVTKKAKTSVGTTFENKSLGFITRDWCIRRAAIKITSSWLFESTVLFLIDDYWGNVLMRETEIVFTLFFALECAIKIVAYGFVGHPSAYIRDPWNWIDFLVVAECSDACFPYKSAVEPCCNLNFLGRGSSGCNAI